MASGYALHPSSVHLLTAQNIGYGTGPNATPAGIVQAWMLSPHHRDNLLDRAYTEVGIGIAPGAPSATDEPGAKRAGEQRPGKGAQGKQQRNRERGASVLACSSISPSQVARIVAEGPDRRCY